MATYHDHAIWHRNDIEDAVHPIAPERDIDTDPSFWIEECDPGIHVTTQASGLMERSCRARSPGSRRNLLPEGAILNPVEAAQGLIRVPTVGSRPPEGRRGCR